MISPRIVMYIAMGGLAWTLIRRYMNKPKELPPQHRHPPIVEPDVVPGVHRNGDDAHCSVVLTPAEALAGKAVQVPSIEGAQQINVPAGVKDGAKLRLAKLGFKRPDGSRGDQFVTVRIQG